MDNTIEVDDEVIQIKGPCRGHVFIVCEKQGDMLRVRLKNPKPPHKRHPEWSHISSYHKNNSRYG